MAHRVLKTPGDVANYAQFLATLKLPLTVEHRLGRDRSLEQNRTAFLWAREAAEQRGDMTADEVRCEWKLHHGVPIMRSENEGYRAVYDAAIRPLAHEHKLKAMRFYQVTSLMTTAQMTRYLETIQRECAEQGIDLTDPDPMQPARRKEEL